MDKFLKIGNLEYPIIYLKDSCPQKEEVMIRDYFSNFDEEKRNFTEKVKEFCKRYEISSSSWFTTNILRKHVANVVVGECVKCQNEIIKKIIFRREIQSFEQIIECEYCEEEEYRRLNAEYLKEKQFLKTQKEKEEKQKQQLEYEENERRNKERNFLFEKAIQRKKWTKLTLEQLNALIDICDFKKECPSSEKDSIRKIVFDGYWDNNNIWKNIIDPIKRIGLLEVDGDRYNLDYDFMVHPNLLTHLIEYQKTIENEFTIEMANVGRPINDKSCGILKILGNAPFTLSQDRIYSFQMIEKQGKTFLKIETSK